MGKYTFADRQKSRPRREVHPVMRGIGCIMIILVPLLHSICMLLVNRAAHGWPHPPSWLGGNVPSLYANVAHKSAIATVRISSRRRIIGCQPVLPLQLRCWWADSCQSSMAIFTQYLSRRVMAPPMRRRPVSRLRSTRARFSTLCAVKPN